MLPQPEQIRDPQSSKIIIQYWQPKLLHVYYDIDVNDISYLVDELCG
jgi:hypothetical protein